MKAHLPRVSAIMITRGRNKWATDALQAFRIQTYSPRQLIIVDDRDCPSFPKADPYILHHFHGAGTVGERRNQAINKSSGEIILHWDDDDIYSPDRIEHQVKFLLAHPEADLVGYHEMEFVDEEEQRRFIYRGSPNYAIGVSQCYWRDTWETRQFEAKNEGEDNAFWAGRRVACCPAAGRIVARIHGGNTSEKRGSIRENPAQWVERPWGGAA